MRFTVIIIFGLINSGQEGSCDSCLFINPLDTRSSYFSPITTQMKLKMSLKTIKIYKYLHIQYARLLITDTRCASSTPQRLVNQSNGNGHRSV